MSAEAQASVATKDMPSGIDRVRRLVRRLIDYGRQLAVTVRQRAAAPDFTLFVKPFGTADLAIILGRIAAGLRRAVALEAALNGRIARGLDLAPAPVREPSVTPRAARHIVAPAQAEPRSTKTEAPHLARLPTEEEIAAEVLRRPVGAVIADICRDLGIAPGRVDPAFWHELSRTIMTYGGSFMRFLEDLDRRWFGRRPGKRANPASSAALPRSPVPATGPP
ncbi:MAG TPA: hypothetical protein VFL55_10545 [Acetobacteraceae bacterium]|nr:hypothetical protein [Acetobacteraceae bacterium]